MTGLTCAEEDEEGRSRREPNWCIISSLLGLLRLGDWAAARVGEEAENWGSTNNLIPGDGSEEEIGLHEGKLTMLNQGALCT